jgi:Resolvase, N terminal domain
MGHLLGYARVSTTDQQPHLQVDALEQAGCYRVFTETASGTRADRPTLEQLLDQLRPGDTLVVWNSTGSADPCATWSTPSPASPAAGSGSAASRRRLTPPRRAASSSSTSSRPWLSSNVISSGSARPRGWSPPGPAAAAAADHQS